MDGNVRAAEKLMRRGNPHVIVKRHTIPLVKLGSLIHQCLIGEQRM